MNIKERYQKLKEKVSGRKPDFDAFITMLEQETIWLTSPASTKYHLNKEGGLLEHSVGVAETLLKLRETLASEITEESCVIVGLLHDVGKVGMPGTPNYLKNTNDWEIRNRNMTYKNNEDLVYMGLAQRSLYLITKYISLTDAEAQAILYHDGQYVEGNKEVAHREVPLTLLVQFADLWSSAVYEEGRSMSAGGKYYGKK